jgi:HAD superfamily hydrolase (TIGR01549 family)
MTNTNQKNIDGILFDFGSTLIETENIPWEKLLSLSIDSGYEFLTKNGYVLPSRNEFSEHFYQRRLINRERANQNLEEWVVTDVLEDIFNSLNMESPSRLAKESILAFYKPISDQYTIYDDTIDVLNEIRTRGLKCGLVSNTIFPEECHCRDLSRFGIDRYLDFALFSSTFGYRKPHPSIYNRAVELIGLPKERLLFVGDMYIEDYIGPDKFGIKSILKYRPGRPYPEPMPPDTRIINRLGELISYL